MSWPSDLLLWPHFHRLTIWRQMPAWWVGVPSLMLLASLRADGVLPSPNFILTVWNSRPSSLVSRLYFLDSPLYPYLFIVTIFLQSAMSTIWVVQDPNVCVLFRWNSGIIACLTIYGSRLNTTVARITPGPTGYPESSSTATTINYRLHGSQFSIPTLISALTLMCLLPDCITIFPASLPVYPTQMLSLSMHFPFLGPIMFTFFLPLSF